eukprot:CAMPEP_0113401728 /NCGR_PEP_ID=MMETSP0013_2-20120614/16859_1 /TAXON_ID=2843 ORGANISM="Skeletonema costatum, Strain 1716" /NCGR_SAMPLE_ID=MMETSP0013_2 /ASSEMBLY_ACC=CAM_ASM_000158 /LENGTH=733 /DNA_ID=CAMNT_0000286979 /DNA_START=115 /DNA_END=2319 /DNA_ORIENTATION=- /assembly_acc=CAM_ASM_000158
MTVEKLRLTLQATDLNNVAGSWKGTSDPYAEVTLLTSDGRELKLDTPKTEVVKNNLSPEWTTSFLFDRSTVEETSIIKVSVVDEVTKEKDPDIPMGSTEFKMEDILGNQGSIKVGKELKEGGTLYARISKVPARSAGKLALSLQGGNLRKDAYFELCRTYDDEDDTSWTPVHRSRPIENYYSNPKWRRASIDVNRLCDGDLNKEIKLALFYYDRKKDDKPMGAFYTTVNELIRTAQSASRELQNNESGAKAQGTITVHECKITGAEPASSSITTANNNESQLADNTSSDDTNESQPTNNNGSDDTNDSQIINNVRIVSYNVLSSKLARPSHFTHSDPDHLTMEYRLPLILQKLEEEMNRSTSSSDVAGMEDEVSKEDEQSPSPPPTIFALQEICYSFTSELHTFFAQRGYQFVTGLYGKSFNGYMGIGIAYPTEHFETVKVDICRLSDERIGGWPREEIDESAAQKKGPGFIELFSNAINQFIRNQIRNRVIKQLPLGGQSIKFIKKLGSNLQEDKPIDPWEMSENRFNVLVSVALRHRHNNGASSGDGTFLISNYHMPCAFYAPPVMNIHAEMVVRRVQTLAADVYESLHEDKEEDIDTIPYILAGDFNVMPDSPHYKLITTGRLDESDPTYPPSKFGVDWTVEAEAMGSAYAVVGEEPEFTNYAHTQGQEEPFIGTLDYIFLSREGKTTRIWKVNEVTKLPSKAESGGPFPNAVEPSDHYLISADLELVSN